jgi:serine/threonine protein kinase
LGSPSPRVPSPLEGLEADARTHIFAFGAVLYEMLTGRKAFEAKSQASPIAAMLDHEPAPLSTLQAGVPRQLDHVMRRRLAKNPDESWQTAADLHRELKWVVESLTQEAPCAEAAVPRPAV